MTGTLEHSATARIRPSPPRGMHRSMYCVNESNSLIASRSAVGNDLDGVRGKCGQVADGGVHHRFGNGLIGMDRFLAAAQNGGVAGFETKAGGVGRDVGARFVNDDDDADGRGNFLQAQAVGARAFVEHAADRIGQGGDFAQARWPWRRCVCRPASGGRASRWKGRIARRFPCRWRWLPGWPARFSSRRSAMASRQPFFCAVVNWAR